MDQYRPDQWHDFFLAVGGGAAALTGLVVVAMSLHLDVIARDPVLRHRARSILTGLAAVFMRCALVLMGGQGSRGVAVELFVVCAIISAAGLSRFLQVSRSGNAVRRAGILRTAGERSPVLLGQNATDRRQHETTRAPTPSEAVSGVVTRSFKRVADAFAGMIAENCGEIRIKHPVGEILRARSPRRREVKPVGRTWRHASGSGSSLWISFARPTRRTASCSTRCDDYTPC